jgi:hypothetical protein
VKKFEHTPGAMRSACGEYECPCHVLAQKLLEALETIRDGITEDKRSGVSASSSRDAALTTARSAIAKAKKVRL